ncbi:MAG TPA: carboxypeptidase-like regulatory domain-containing protein [Gemmatimonadaceae bacterium]|nr:carboxypeptidase-like regulatory domain-containing protein [Gemmatimonadaceae bacterium]
MSFRRIALLLAFLVSGVAAAAGAQESDIIRGKVTGPDSLPLENVKVTAMSMATNQSISRNTNAEGRFTIIFPNGGGDYIVSYTAIGFQPTQKQVKREQDEAILIADQSLGKTATMLQAIRVTAQRQQVDRNDDARTGGGVGAGDRGIDMSQVGIGAQGDLAAMAASLPGVTYIPGADGGPAGFSILGLGAEQNLTTLNGLDFGGSDLPRDAMTMGRVSSNPFNPGQGGFSGGQLALRTAPGTNFVTQTVRFTAEPQVLQFTDQAGQQLGTQYNNFTASGAWRGPITLDKLYFSTSLQGSRRMQDLQTLLNTDAYALQTVGISADSAARLRDLLGSFGIPTSIGVDNKVNDAFSGIAQIDWTPGAGHNFTFTGNGSLRRQQAAGLNSTRQIASNGGETQNWNTALQARHSSYFWDGFLSETSTALQLSRSQGDPYLAIPDANIRVASTFPDGTTGSVQTLVVGGNPAYPTDSKTLTWQTNNSISWISMDNRHRWQATQNVRLSRTQTDNSRNRLGTYTYNSLEDFENGRPASFTRLLSPRIRTGNDLALAFALSDTYRPRPRLQIQYGPRIDVLRFNVAPTLNPALEAKFGIRNDHVPTGIFVSPRVGFSYGYGTNSQIAGFQGAQRGSRYQISGGFGKFQNIPNSNLVSNAIDNTGLPSALQQLNCVGTAVPVVDWTSYVNGGEIPDECANGTQGTVFANNSPNVSLFARGYKPQASYRGSLSWGGPILRNGYRVNVSGTMSLNQNQQGTIDLNLDTTSTGAFTLGNEGNRPVFVAPSSIVTTTGAIGSRASRIDTSFSRVTSYVSDLRSISRQVSVSLSPILFNVNYRWSLSYVLQSVRDQQRGFGSNTAGNPFVREWGRASSDSRHAIQGNFNYTFRNAVTFSTNARLSSGTPFSPIVQGDVNGDGQSNDRAFIFDPAAVTDPATKSALEAVYASSPMKDCLTSQIGRIAGRNSCQAPWFFNIQNMQVSFVSSALRLPQRATVRMGLSNVLTGIDMLVHGSDGVHGWGQQPNLDPTLLYVRGFDPATSSYRYEVNPRFGDNRQSNAGIRNPFMLSIDVSYDIGPERERQQLNLTLRTGRRGDASQQKLSEQQLFQRYSNSIQNPFDQILRQMDTLQLTTEQADSLASLNRIYSRYRDETWRPVARYLAGLPDDYDLAEAWNRVKTAQNAVLEKMVVLGPAAKRLLTREQLNRLPVFISIYLDESSIRAVRPGNANGRGRFGG